MDLIIIQGGTPEQQTKKLVELSAEKTCMIFDTVEYLRSFDKDVTYRKLEGPGAAILYQTIADNVEDALDDNLDFICTANTKSVNPLIYAAIVIANKCKGRKMNIHIVRIGDHKHKAIASCGVNTTYIRQNSNKYQKLLGYALRMRREKRKHIRNRKKCNIH